MNDYYDGGRYDPETVRFFDVAHEGAQVRAVSGVVERLAELRGRQPRSIVVVATDHIALASARFAAATRAPLRMPLVVCDRMPGYIGPLDVVLAVGDRADDSITAQALITAANRGATTVFVGPPRGPILDDLPGDCLVVPSLPTAAGASPARTVTAVGALLDALEEDPHLITERLTKLAEDIDDEAAQLSPERGEVVNLGRQLHAWADGARVLHTGVDRDWTAVAELISSLWSSRGLASGWTTPEELPTALRDMPVQPDVFHDPFLDGPSTVLPLKVIVWGAETTDLANATAVEAPASGLGHLGQVHRLITRGFAVTTYNGSEDDAL